MKLVAIVLLLASSFVTTVAQENLLKFQEVFDLLRTNLVDVSEDALSDNAAKGLIKELGTKVQLITTNIGPAMRETDAVPKKTVFNDNIGFIRVKSVDDRLPAEFRRALSELMAKNELAGVIVDLRFAHGTNYEAAAQVADEFVKEGQPLLRLATRLIDSTDETEAVELPIAVLVNSETRAAAEAVAGILRENAASLVIGSKTAGEARLFEVFSLSSGQKLRVGRIPIEVGRGKVLPSTGIVPDIEVAVDPDEARFFYQDPYRERRVLSRSGSTNQVSSALERGRPVNEAELVRRHRDGFSFEDGEVPATAETPVITDPTLARALDFLKGVSILQPRRPR